MHKFDTEDKKETIKKEILHIKDMLGKTPTMKDYKKYAKNNIRLEQVTYLFGKWSSAIEYARLPPNPFRNPPRAPEISKEELISDFIKVANEIGKIPGMLNFRSKSIYSWTPYKTKWGSWRNAVDYIVENYKNKFHFSVETLKLNKKQNKQEKELSYNCPLKYAPRNELETIVLFAYLANELGYKIKKIQSSFPDAVLEKNGQEVFAEFEFLSSNYLEHCHPCKKDYICICWRKDIDLKETSIFSLEEYLRKNYKYITNKSSGPSSGSNEPPPVR